MDWNNNNSDTLHNSTTLYSLDYLPIYPNITLTGEDSEYGGDAYGDFNVEDRANKILSEPNKIVAIILGLIAVVANIFSLFVMCRILRETRGPTSHNALILSLAASDLLFCLTVMLHIINKILNPLFFPGFGPEDKRLSSRCAYTIIKSLNTTALNVTLLNLMGMAMDHYIAILKPLHYTRLLNKRDACIIMILLFWIIAFVFGFSDFIYVFKDWDDWHMYKDKFNLCEFVHISEYHEEYIMFCCTFLCLVVMVCVYIRYDVILFYKTSCVPCCARKFHSQQSRFF